MAHQHKRKIESVLPDLIALFSSWNLDVSDWIIALHYAEILQGYDIRESLRPGHINIFVRASALPWETPKKLLGVESIVPVNSVFERKYASFHKKTGFEFDLIPYGNPTFNAYVKSYALDFIKGDAVCRILNVRASVEIIKSTLALGQEKIGEKTKRILLHLEEISDSAATLGDKDVRAVSNDLIQRYARSFKEHPLLNRTKDTITGHPVYGNVVEGRVCLVANPDTPIVNTTGLTNCILVCPRISKRLALYIPQVAAIITDDGGILSHAAIVAREMKKPCIIGTRVATKMFKNGETVRVDAAKGTVMRIGKVKRHRSIGNPPR